MSNVTQYETIKLDDRAAVRKAHQAIADMLNVRIEDGNLESVVVLMVNKAKGDTVEGANRFFVQVGHLDLIEDAFIDVIKYLSEKNGVTPAEVRANRLRALERAKAAKVATPGPGEDA
jgi:hypothetical protein